MALPLRCFAKTLLLAGTQLSVAASSAVAQSSSPAAHVLLQARVNESVGIAWSISSVPQPLDSQLRASLVAVESLWQLENGRTASTECWVDQERGAAAELLALHSAKDSSQSMIWSFAPRPASRIVQVESLRPEQRSSHQVHGVLVVNKEQADSPSPDPRLVRLRVTVF